MNFFIHPETAGKTHFWVSIVIGSLGQGVLADCLNRFSFVRRVFLALFPGLLKKLSEDTAKHEAYTTDLVNK